MMRALQRRKCTFYKNVCTGIISCVIALSMVYEIGCKPCRMRAKRAEILNKILVHDKTCIQNLHRTLSLSHQPMLFRNESSDWEFLKSTFAPLFPVNSYRKLLIIRTTLTQGLTLAERAKIWNLSRISKTYHSLRTVCERKWLEQINQSSKIHLTLHPPQKSVA